MVEAYPVVLRITLPHFRAAPEAEEVVQTLEQTVGMPFDHYFSHTRHKKLPGSRSEFLERWIPEALGHNDPQLLSTGRWVLREHALLSILTFPDGRSYPGGLSAVNLQGNHEHICSALEQNFEQMITTLQPWGMQLSAKCENQQMWTKQNFERSLASCNGDPRLLEVHEKRREKYRYDLNARTLQGRSPIGTAFTFGLRWMNYWCNETADALRFPDPKRDQPLVGLFRSVGRGWIVRLSEEPLDLDNPTHIGRLQWAYDRFSSP